MNCQEARERLPALIDQELSPEETAEVELHLAGCAECTAEKGRQEKFTTSVKISLEGLKPSDVFVKKVIDRLPETGAAPAAAAPGPEAAAANRRTVLSIVLALAVIAAALIAMWVIHQKRAGQAAATGGGDKPPAEGRP